MNPKADISKPTKRQVVVPIIVLLITLVIGGILLFVARSTGAEEEAETIFTAPGTQTITVTRPGEYTLDVAIETTYEGKTYTLPEDFTGIKGELSYEGKAVELTELASTVYGKEGQKGKTLFAFTAQQPGDYILTTTIDHMNVTEAVLVSRRADSKNGTIVILATCACFIVLMGVCQFVAYGVFNLVKWGVFVFHNKNR